jgi:3-oxoacyl-[acyl-carrier-protein] synthase II
MLTEKVVVTGLGVVSSIGLNLGDFKDALVEGRCGAQAASMFNAEGYDSVKACEVKHFDPSLFVENTPLEELGRSSKFSIAAAQMAIEDGGLKRSDISGKNIPVCIGTTDGESQSLDELAWIWAKKGLEKFDADLVEQSVASNLSNSISREFGLCGESVTISTACSAGNYAIGHAFDLLQSGRAKIAICGGSDSVCRKTYSGFSRLGTIAPEKCQPFDVNRKGLLTGEGAGVLVLETLSSALERGAKIYAEVLGYGLNCDANHMVAPNMESVASCIRMAHKNAGVSPEQVDYICAHGTGTVANDVTESGAIKSVYDNNPPPVSSIKSMLGHTMGAASAIASIACVLSIHHQFIPPTINHEIHDENCIDDCVPNESRTADVRVVQNNGFAFGGNNAITMYGKYEKNKAVA